MIKVNLGCGWRNFGKEWIHIDNGEYEHLDFRCDVRNTPLSNESVDLIYSSHVIAYFDRIEVLDFLKECNRVLKKGGILRLATPDFHQICKLYLENKIILNKFLGPIFGKMNMGDSTIYHKTTYDLDSLSELLISNGFDKPNLYDWKNTEHRNFDDHSQAYIPHMDKENGTLISLNVESFKL